MPASERFQTDGAVREEIVNRLEFQKQVRFEVGMAQFLGDETRAPDARFMLGRENHRRSATAFLAEIQRGVGAFEHLRDRRAGFRKRGPADRSRQLGDIAGHAIRRAERVANALSQLDEHLVRLLVLHEHAEFIAAEARKEQARVGLREQAQADFLKDQVAARVPVDVVDLFEAVEVDQPDIEAGPRGERLFRQRAQRCEEAAPVGQVGQTVDAREPEVVVAEPLRFLLARLQLALRVHHVGEGLVIELNVDGKRDADQRHVDRHRDEHRIAGENEEGKEA